MNCILHPDRKAKRDVTGILVCDECFEVYTIERRTFQSLKDRSFFQSLNNARHGLPLAAKEAA